MTESEDPNLMRLALIGWNLSPPANQGVARDAVAMEGVRFKVAAPPGASVLKILIRKALNITQRFILFIQIY